MAARRGWTSIRRCRTRSRARRSRRQRRPPDTIPAEDFQTVDLKLVAQTDTAGQLADSTVLDHRFTAADDAIGEIFLYFQPDVSGLGGTILGTLTGIQNYQPLSFSSTAPSRRAARSS